MKTWYTSMLVREYCIILTTVGVVTGLCYQGVHLLWKGEKNFMYMRKQQSVPTFLGTRRSHAD